MANFSHHQIFTTPSILLNLHKLCLLSYCGMIIVLVKL